MDSLPIPGTAAELITAAAAAAALLYLLGLLLKIALRVDAIGTLVRRELAGEHDGSTIKDDVHGMAVALGKMQRDREEDRMLIDLALRRLLRDHPADLELMRAVRTTTR